MNGPVDIPSIDQLIADPAKVATLPPETARDLSIRLATLQPLLIGQAMKAMPKDKLQDDSFVDKTEVAGLISLSVSWIEKHPDDLPPRFSVEGNPRWLKSEVLAWMKSRPRYGKST